MADAELSGSESDVSEVSAMNSTTPLVKKPSEVPVSQFLKQYGWIFLVSTILEAYLKYTSYNKHPSGGFIYLPWILSISWTYTENRRSGLGLLDWTNDLQFIFFHTLALSFVLTIIYLATRPRASRLFRMGAVFYAAGAVGNYMDRLSVGFVVDYWKYEDFIVKSILKLLPYHFNDSFLGISFNWSDLVLNAAVTCCIIDILRRARDGVKVD